MSNIIYELDLAIFIYYAHTHSFFSNSLRHYYRRRTDQMWTLINEPVISSTTDADDDMEILPFERVGRRCASESHERASTASSAMEEQEDDASNHDDDDDDEEEGDDE